MVKKLDIYVQLFLSGCNEFSKAVNKLNKGMKDLHKNIEETAFFSSTPNIFNLFKMFEIVWLHGSVKEIWEGVNEGYVHYVKD